MNVLCEYGYQRGEVSMDEGTVYLPHSCDEWVIGGPDQVRMLIEDLNELLRLLQP